MYKVKDKTKELASRILGIDYNDFSDMDYADESKYLRKVINGNPKFIAENDERIVGRGNPLLSRGEFLTIEEVDNEL